MRRIALYKSDQYIYVEVKGSNPDSNTDLPPTSIVLEWGLSVHFCCQPPPLKKKKKKKKKKNEGCVRNRDLRVNDLRAAGIIMRWQNSVESVTRVRSNHLRSVY